MENSFTFQRNILYKNSAIFLEFASDIQKLIVLEDSIVVLLHFNSSVGDQNIYCYDFNKQILWQIPKPITIHERNYFTGIYLIGKELYAYNESGVEYHLAKESGQFLNSELIR